MRFEDFKWLGVPVMPKRWNDEVDQATLTRITFANIVEMKEGWTHRWNDKGSGCLREVQDGRVCVVLDLPFKRRFCDVPIGNGKALFRLVERFTNFNLRKVMRSIVDMELDVRRGTKRRRYFFGCWKTRTQLVLRTRLMSEWFKKTLITLIAHLRSTICNGPCVGVGLGKKRFAFGRAKLELSGQFFETKLLLFGVHLLGEDILWRFLC
ncbi:hypothetical protein M427DRAFT_355360 [Gonapodya prolifera JEL478]|uniref:Uncharacterized protein n=1 Tax=Gonapodya prolifera (strain JEL478) TaxID=1344416 RepID=A0A139ABN2_GONPJ|nr:hypothetical protein M427DRAFT_355360 [Gonapodya prolifera JEL478]|eukprot:KXS14170.1 hypothetical protein M427DRAFT_355360 [Gonapodya prolifera JEL478]